jgi:cyclophilin family peptidyl-prolyl cis-trans isomerase
MVMTLQRWGRLSSPVSKSLLPSYGDGKSSGSGSPRQFANDALEWRAGHSPLSSNNRKDYSTSKRITALFILVTVLSWTAAGWTTTRTHLLLRKMQDQQARYRLVLSHSMETLDQTIQAHKQETALLKKWSKTHAALEHESRVMNELAEADVQMYPLPNHAPSSLVTEWLMHRQAGLQRQVDNMARHLQHASKLAVLERYVLSFLFLHATNTQYSAHTLTRMVLETEFVFKSWCLSYGPGPHRVRFTAELGENLNSTFIVELVPVEAMPHSVHFFLDLVAAHVWDHTVFLHHEDVDHVMATAPIDYYTQKVKFMHLHTLGWANLGFPEYHEDFPHEKYTLGFAGQGPTFYINTMDNARIHGPGGQGHHLLPQDADPCFGKVVEGQDVVDALGAFGLQEVKSSSSSSAWYDGDHAWTHIVSVEIL